MRTQYFMFFSPQSGFDISAISNDSRLEPADGDWDFCLVDRDGEITAYRSNGEAWQTLERGSNPWELVFIDGPSRRVPYSEHPQFQKLGR
jgi:hypothetical protein